MADESACVTHGLVVIRESFRVVTASRKLGEDIIAETRLQPQGIDRLAPCSPEYPARCGDRGLWIHPEIHDSSEYRGLCLRLPIPAHRAVNQGTPVTQDRERWIERV